MPSAKHTFTAITALLATSTHAQVSLYKPCPLLGPFFPAPTIDSTSPAMKSEFDLFTKFIDGYIAKGVGLFGPITPNKTSFSIGLFAGDNLVNATTPSFYEYHHGADEVQPDADSVYAAGDLMQLFTVFTLLREMGDWVLAKGIVEFLPELESMAQNESSVTRVVDWKEVTLGALSGHMAGTARDSDACKVDQPCDKDAFLSKFAPKPPVYLPDTTPIYSHAAFQLLAFAIEQQCHEPFEKILTSRILDKLNMTSTSLLTSNKSTLFGNGLSNSSLIGEPASLSLLTSTHDLALFGHSILTSSLLPAATTRRWLKPFTSTSNLANAVSRPWEIYHYSSNVTDPIIDIYTKTGTIGRYSSYFGLSPDYNVGFSILAVNDEGEAPDLNAYADMVLFALLQITALARKEAQATYASVYTGPHNSSLILNVTSDDPGIAITHLTVNGSDWLSEIADKSGIETKHIDFRLYPTDLIDGEARAFRGVIQDRNALVDAGTPTCVSWQTIGVLERNDYALDEFIFEINSRGQVKSVHSYALGMMFEK